MKIQAREALIAANQLLLFSHYNEGSFLLSIKLRKKRGPGVTTLFSISRAYMPLTFRQSLPLSSWVVLPCQHLGEGLMEPKLFLPQGYKTNYVTRD